MTVTNYGCKNDTYTLDDITTKANNRYVLRPSRNVIFVDDVHRRRAIVQLILRRVLPGGDNTIAVYYVRRGGDKTVVYSEPLKMSRLANEATAIVWVDTHFLVTVQHVITYVKAFLEDYSANITRAKIRNIVEHMMSS